MSKKANKYLEYLANSEKLLYIGKENIPTVLNDVEAFSEIVRVTSNETVLDDINMILLKHEIHVVILDAQDNNKNCISFYKKIDTFDENILIMLMIDPQNCASMIELFPKVDMIVSNGIDEELLEKKLFNLLSPIYTKNCLLSETMKTHKHELEKESISEFLDTYEGSSLFISDELLTILKELDSGVLSKNTLMKIVEELNEVADIFNAIEKTRSVVPIYKELASFLKELDLDTIEAKNIKGFEFLSDILSDIGVYLIDMFVERIFNDVYVFKDSLKNNIDYMKNSINGVEENDGELDFF